MMPFRRVDQTAALLENGTALVVGGTNASIVDIGCVPVRGPSSGPRHSLIATIDDIMRGCEKNPRPFQEGGALSKTANDRLLLVGGAAAASSFSGRS
jgi:hypothetical protein